MHARRMIPLTVTVLLAGGLGSCTASVADLSASRMAEAFPDADRFDPVTTGQDNARMWVARSAGGAVGYAVEKQVVARSGPFTILVLIGPDLRVRHAEVLEYAHVRGRGVLKPHFARQFVGKGANDPLRVGRDVDAVSGATISSRAMTGGVRDALRMVRRHVAANEAHPALSLRPMF